MKILQIDIAKHCVKDKYLHEDKRSHRSIPRRKARNLQKARRHWRQCRSQLQKQRSASSRQQGKTHHWQKTQKHQW